MSWTNVTVGDAFDFVRNGKSIKQSKEVDGLPITRIETIADRIVDPARVGYAGLNEAGNEQWLLRKGDILFSHINSVDHIGKCAIYEGVPEKLIHGMNLLTLRPGRLLHPKFAYYVLSHDTFRARLLPFVNKAVNQASVSTTNLKTLEMPLPPLNEQKRIAAILDKADQLRQKRRQAIALLDSLTQSIFLEMFGDPVKNDKSFAAGRISDWVEDFETGKNLAPDPDNSDPLSYRVLKVSAVTSGIFKAEEAKALPKSYRAPLNHLIHKGDLLFSRANTAELIGATAMVHTDYERIVLPDKIWRFAWNAKNKPNPLFVHGMFSSSSFRGEISKRATGTSGSMKNISKEKVLNIHIGMPERQLQDDFAKRIEATQRCRLKCENQLNVLEAHFSSLQHRAFSGQL
ncbi:restriction endonuclease subunit S [Rhizobium laguerreae]|uniref:restriction endonuclease subunit S n=1 Tax=Rhizobium laguerreae TaxID=1076926 RepID=UPI001C916DC2|nr:hypothetical protein [Rhizobium laguerreae]